MKYDISVCGMENDEALKAEEYIKGKDKVLEWGSGGTTLYFPQIVNTYVSMEHDSGSVSYTHLTLPTIYSV